MFSRKFTYTGFDGQPHEDTWWFNYTQAELVEMELGSFDGLSHMMERLLRKNNSKEIVRIFKNLILNAVGEKSPDGRKFIKNEEIREDFYQTQAYSDLFTELVTDASKFASFMKACAPENIREAIETEEKKSAEKNESKLSVVTE